MAILPFKDLLTTWKDGISRALRVKVEGDVQLTGSNMEQRGKEENKPAADTVAIGTTYWSVDVDPHGYAIEISDGMNWTVI